MVLSSFKRRKPPLLHVNEFNSILVATPPCGQKVTNNPVILAKPCFGNFENVKEKFKVVIRLNM